MLFRHLLGVLFLTLFLPACDSGKPVQARKGAVQAPQMASGDDWFKLAKDALVIKHRYRVGMAPGWKAEFWLRGSSFPRNEAIDVTIRLTPDEDHLLKNLPPISVNLAVSRLGEGSKVYKFQPVIDWQVCSEMAPRAESTYEDGKYGNDTCFPPKNSCWEGTVIDAFQSPKTRPFEIGEYLLQADIVIGNDTKIEIKKVKMKIYKGFEPPAAVPEPG